MIIAFTGVRPQKLGGFTIPNPIYNYVCKELQKCLEEIKPTKAISGMALGFDQMAAEVCLDLGIPLVAAIPCDNQDRMWPQESKDDYQDLLSKCSEVIIVNPGPYAAWKMQARNIYMVDNCEAMIAASDGTPGGTKNCLDYAAEVNRKIIKTINPKDFKNG
jgi:uncharacterized phage-like protein YoqJ